MLKEVYEYFGQRVLEVTDSWFGNDGLWSKLERGGDGIFHLLSRMRSNIVLYDFPSAIPEGKRRQGKPRKYGARLGSVDECAARYKGKAKEYSVCTVDDDRPDALRRADYRILWSQMENRIRFQGD